MLLPPDLVDVDALCREIEACYGAQGSPPEFMALGEDSRAYRLGGLRVSLRRDPRGHVPAAYEAAAALRRAGLDSVLAPLNGSDGRTVRQIEGIPVLVFPYLADTAQLTRETASEADRDDVETADSVSA